MSAVRSGRAHLRKLLVAGMDAREKYQPALDVMRNPPMGPREVAHAKSAPYSKLLSGHTN